MLNHTQRAAKWLPSCVYGHFSLWSHSLRTMLAAIFILLMNYMLTRSTANAMSIYQFDVHLGETLYFYAASGFNMIMTSTGLLVMLSELPKRVAYQNYTLLRLSRRKWLVSLVIFCMVIVFAFTVLMLASSALFSLSFVTPGGGWSDLERLAADEDYIYEYQFVAEYIRELSPAAACVLACAILYLFWLTMAFLITLFSLWDIPNFGVVFCVCLLLADIIILFEGLPGGRLPGQYSTLNKVASQVWDNRIAHAVKVIGAYLLLDGLLLVLMGARIKRMDIRFMEKG